jgi:hypothetical protein
LAKDGAKDSRLSVTAATPQVYLFGSDLDCNLAYHETSLRLRLAVSAASQISHPVLTRKIELSSYSSLADFAVEMSSTEMITWGGQVVQLHSCRRPAEFGSPDYKRLVVGN